MSIKLLFLWHMHQPDYRDKNGYLSMPWVFLHSIKDYYDMPWIASRYENIKITFNITPTLIEQIKIYEDEGCSKDIFLQNWLKEPSLLHKSEKDSVIKICKSAQFEKVVKPFSRFVELYQKEEYNFQELIDLEMLFLLSMCGTYLRLNSDIVKKYIKKGRDYNQNDKIELLNELISFVKEILPFYKRLLENKKISLSTTPYNHPILPLLLDMQNAKISNPATTLPKGAISLKDDAIKQIEKAVELFKTTFNSSPTGFWPAEGAVDEKSISLYKNIGLKWIATDEEILFKSLNDYNRENLYSLHSFDDILIGFRDHPLSDAIGFLYKDYDPNSAVDDFVGKLNSINHNGDRYIFVILDGENAWDFYENNGYNFLDSLYHRLNDTKEIEVKRFDDILDDKTTPLKRLHPGSWIYGNFNTWSGESEKNRAWELLFQTKKDTIEAIKILDLQKRELVLSHFLAAECSDWFWWYGSDHYSDFLAEFDILFRSHLIDIYILCGLDVPYELKTPIIDERKILSRVIKPQRNLKVKVNGEIDSFYEWLDAGIIDEGKSFSTMDGKNKIIEKIYYGEDKKRVYLRVEGDMREFFHRYKTIRVDIKESKNSILIPIKEKYTKGGISLAIKDVIEISFSKKFCKEDIENHIKIALISKDLEIEFLPTFSEIVVCNEKEYIKNWFI